MTDREQARGDRPILDFHVVVSRLSKNGLKTTYEASPEELRALAQFLGLVAIDRLDAELAVTPWRKDGVSVVGRLRAALTQASVVTLAPLAQEIDEPVEIVFLPEGSRLQRIDTPEDGELHLDPEGDDIPETYKGDRIDLGSALQEVLALAIEPYPREADAVFEEFDTDPEPDDRQPSPFAGLKALRGKADE